MIIKRALLVTAFISASVFNATAADKGDVVVTIKPVHSLVSAVMAGVSEPDLLVKGAASGHGYNLKPSDAKMLENAKVIFWIGPEMEAFLTKPLGSLGSRAQVVQLENVPGLELLEAREDGNFEPHDHGHAHHHDGEGHEHHHDDMHIWLDPQNAKLMLKPIADALSKADPDHAKQYQDNAAAYAVKLDALRAELAAQLQPVAGKPYVVFHDAYQYFERRFGLSAAGSITVNTETAPGAARIREIQDKVKSLGAACVFSEPQFESRLVHTVLEGTQAKTGVLDPLGADIKDGPELYPQLMRNLASSLKNCLK